MIAPWGWPVLIPVAVVLGVAVWVLPPGIAQAVGAVVAALLGAFCLWFFRHPQRTPPPGEHRLVAAADGVIDDLAEAECPELGGRAIRLGIFLSVFDVHVNRSPIAGTIVSAVHRQGSFLDARHRDAGSRNEALTLLIEADPAVAPGLRLLVRQIAGLIARRIICARRPGEHLNRGECYGMIRFGSRTEIWLPLDRPHRILVKPGDRVRGGETVVAELLP